MSGSGYSNPLQKSKNYDVGKLPNFDNVKDSNLMIDNNAY